MSSDIPLEERTCANCKYKETAGAMVDPCFPCLFEFSIFTGLPKSKYDAWVDDRLSWEEIQRRDQELLDEMSKIIDESPELKAKIEKLFGFTL